jgi:hypothetical protein
MPVHGKIESNKLVDKEQKLKWIFYSHFADNFCDQILLALSVGDNVRMHMINRE